MDTRMLQLMIQIIFHFTLLFADESLYFIKCLPGSSRLSHQYRTEGNKTLLSCCRLCYEDQDCMAVNYHEEESICEFNSRNVYFVSYESVNEDGWDIYSAIYERDCGEPKQIDHAVYQVLATATGFGYETVYTCFDGYSPYPTGTSTSIKCLSDGNWSDNHLSCAVATIGEECRDDSDCLEENSRCVNSRDATIGWRCHCKLLFEYVEVNRSCEQACEKYGSTFTLIQETYIHKYNVATGMNTKGVTLDFCTELCLNMSDNCPTFDFGFYCHPNSLSFQQGIRGDLVHQATDYDLYVRDCADAAESTLMS